MARRRNGVGCGCLAAALVLVVLMVAVTRTPKPTAQATPTAGPPLATVLDVAGSGIQTTQSFAVGPSWEMAWSYDCSAFGQSGNFIVNVYLPGGRMSTNAGTDQLGLSGNAVEHFHQGGTFYLEMNSECRWHVTVKG